MCRPRARHSHRDCRRSEPYRQVWRLQRRFSTPTRLQELSRVGSTPSLADIPRDLALIQLDSIPEDVLELKISSEGATPGDTVHSVGNPGVSGALWVYTSGSVRSVYKKKWKMIAGRDIADCEARVI